MGSKCSTLRKGKRKDNKCCKPDSEEEAVSTKKQCRETPPPLKTSRVLQEEGGREEGGTITLDETLQRQEEDSSSENLKCSGNSSGLVHQNVVAEVSSPSPHLSETHNPTSAITAEKEEAEWVTNNRAKLIKEVKLVMPIADQMFKQCILHEEMYENIKAARTPQEQMRELYKTLTTTHARATFYKILQENQPAICQTEDVIKKIIMKYKEDLWKRSQYELEGTEKDDEQKQSLDKIYTELHIVQGESEHVNTEHEIREIEEKSRCKTAKDTKINCNDIFVWQGSVSSTQDKREVREIRTVMTKGIAGIGKTVSVKKFILDWVEGQANQKLDLIFVLPFRELNLVIDRPYSLETLVKEFHPELKNLAVAKIFANYRVLFIFDGLDESQLKLDFINAERLTDSTETSSVDTLVTNLIRRHLLSSALVWITSRPGAVQRIPRQYVHQWTEVRGFDDPQKIQYFRNRVEDKAVAERIIDNITTSRSLFIMCHIPIFCWIASKVLAHLLNKMGNAQEEDIPIPTTLTEMYTHFLCIQMQLSTEKYYQKNEPDREEIFKLNEAFIFKLGRMAFEHLNEGKIIFTDKDLEKYGIDKKQAGVHCGLCTQMFKEDSVFHRKKFYCFVHLTVQEYFAALFVYRSFALKKIDSPSLKHFLLQGSEESLGAILDADPVDLPVNELLEISIANSTQRKTGELDMFLRFLTGMSLESTQKELLGGLIQQEEEHFEMVQEIKRSLLEIDLGDCSPERCLNLVHCLIELKDNSLHETVQKYLKPDHNPDTRLSPVKCSVLADAILMSNRPLDEFNLKKYRPSAKGIFRLLPAVRNSRKARISGVTLDVWMSETISSALLMPNSVLAELHLINCVFYEKGTEILIEGLRHSNLEALSLSGNGVFQPDCENMAEAIKSLIPNLRELELSSNTLRNSLHSILSVGLESSTLEKLRLNLNPGIAKICAKLVEAFTSKPCSLRELELNFTIFKDSEMEIFSTGLTSTNCILEVLSLRYNKLTEKGCKMLASVLSSKSSHLRELDLSYNDLQDSGVMALCPALMTPHCGLKKLSLSFCKVAVDGCFALASALRSDHCSLKELDLSFNYLGDQGVKLLTEIQKDSRCSLEKLNMDQNEEFWFDLKLLRQYACDLTLDRNTAGPTVVLTEEKKRATDGQKKQPNLDPDSTDRFETAQVLCDQGLTGRHYWEVECDTADVGVAYRSMDRYNDCSSESSLGGNEKSWCLTNKGRFRHNNSCMDFVNCPTYSTMGVYLDWPAGILSFFEVLPDELSHLYTVCTAFTEPLHPCFFFAGGSVYLL